MKTNLATRKPVLICAAVMAAVCAVQLAGRLWPQFDFFPRLEWITYDARVRLAARFPSPPASNLGFVDISDDSIAAILDGDFGRLPYHFGLYWPRQVYGRLVSELSAQGAAAVGFDVLFAELRPDHPPAVVAGGRPVDSDSFFAAELRRAGNVILGAEKGLPPHNLFRTNALALGNISALRDADGILRRAQAYDDIYVWHEAIQEAARQLRWDLSRARVQPEQILFPAPEGREQSVALTNDNQFDPAGLVAELTGQKRPAGTPVRARAFTRVRCWHMGIVMAARALKLDLDSARIEPEKGRIVLSGAGGITRTIPIDAQGRFYVDWSLTPYNPALTALGIEAVLEQYEQRRAGLGAQIPSLWKDKLVVVGSTATGNDLTDLGATPLEKETYLLSQQWNVANSVLTGRFVRAPTLALELALIVVLGALAGFLSWNCRVLTGLAGVLGVALLYLAAAAWVYVRWRWWLPVVLPALVPLMVSYVSLVAYRVIYEQKERRRITEVFGKIVSPNVRDELLEAPQLSALGGVRREITVLFADIRGFTEMTDTAQMRVDEFIRRKQLSGAEAEWHSGQQAQEVFRTVNLYLSLIADTVKKHDGTLDKYIGDCVMAFWGAPTPNEKHALACVRAALEAQEAILRLNQERASENQRREAENSRRAARGEEPLPLLPLLAVGVGINTGLAAVGLIGSEAHIRNYTVFGREVNIASRLQETAGPGRVIIAEATFRALQRDDPALAAACVELPPATLKGIRIPVPSYEAGGRH